MANEFIHIDPGAILTKAEFELITGHQFNSQATGDILYASNSTQLSRLGIGSNTNVLEITGGVPAWVATSGTGSVARVTSPTFVTPALGTPASGVMTNVSGTASSLTAGTVTTNANLTGHVTSSGNAAVLGSFTSAQLATALTNETGSGAAVFGTSPTLVTPALGTPASGVLTNATGLPEAGLAVSNSPTNGYMLTAQSGDAGGMTWAAAGGPSQANQAAIEAETNEDTYAPPDLLHFGPWAIKCHIDIPADGSVTPAAGNSYGIASVGDTGTGDRDVNFTTAFSTVTYTGVGGTADGTAGFLRFDTATTGDCRVVMTNTDNSAAADLGTAVAFMGDFA